MSASEQFRAKAAEMTRRAQEAGTAQERWAFVDIAVEWRKLAEAAAALEARSSDEPRTQGSGA